MNIQSLQEKHLEAIKTASEDSSVIPSVIYGTETLAQECTKITLEYCFEFIDFNKYQFTPDEMIVELKLKLSELNKQSL